jgi:hypothetical protein
MSQEIKRDDWKLWMCDQANGRDFLYRWGSEADMRKEMAWQHEHGRDVWLIDPAQNKHLPE